LGRPEGGSSSGDIEASEGDVFDVFSGDASEDSSPEEARFDASGVSSSSPERRAFSPAGFEPPE
jgi:hypothetical protein